MNDVVRPSMGAIIVAVSRHYGLNSSDLLSRRRAQRVALPRQVAMWLARELTLNSYPEIGRAIGDRDHTTIMHGCGRIALAMRADPNFCLDVLDLRDRIAP